MLSRRRFLAIVVTGLVVTGFGASLPSIRQRFVQLFSARHVPGPESDGILESKLSNTLVSFVGALFGQDLTQQDRHELSGIVSFAASADSGWIPEYRWLVSHIDNMANESGAESFSSATPVLRESIMHTIISRPTSSFTLRLLAIASGQVQFRRRMIITTIPHLRRIYLASGVPWRRRGYQSWPGVPGDPRVYTQPGPAPKC
jgi:hypothetical protein